MFLAIIVPPAKKNLVIMISVLVSFAASYACTKLPYVSQLSGGTRTIILTVVISTIVALVKPISDTENTVVEPAVPEPGRRVETTATTEEQ